LTQTTLPRPAPRRAVLVAVAAAAAATAVAGCRFTPKGGHWVEAHGTALAKRLAAGTPGVTIMGMDGGLYLYPTDWARPWRALGGQPAKAIAASATATYIISPANEVVRIVNGAPTPYAGSVGWGATGLAASTGDQLFVIVGGHLRRVADGEPRDAPCGDVGAVTASAVSADEVYVVDGAGALHRGTPAGCTTVSTPAPLRDVAALGDRVVVVTNDGSVWRKKGADPSWRELAPVRKYRPGRRPYLVEAQQVSLSPTSTWLLDTENSVFLLSDQT
jgi:hypothetical protein